ncbi:Sodium/hydrogen exchanger-family protein [Candidatus Protochlamydia naegleriophila]|uniref:Sodium/hydrogen exchanger-family protein n=1 Tax=Candidatus Protochlamydia naegleriophila TaxID=389348 RepID=A0A0U5JDK6_9BACT|nr:cation:proton antiporter [Candidatus Protochlamydia naegleriophila]CUI17598.1 Sodium/hydrogen exchanger-family protein [Candidatus Protochlamydia naegleriophila]
MTMDSYNLKIVLILAIGFSLASLLGYFTQRLKLSPILGYLLAGYIIGPYSPGFVADITVSEQLAEIGVVLMLFGVGLHLKWEDLVNVRNIAVPGAIGQTLVAATCGALLVYSIGWPIEVGIIVGLAIGVASTVVLVRVLSDNHLLDTVEGHVAIGWLIVEDILTVLVLILLPVLATLSSEGQLLVSQFFETIGWAIAKFFLLAILMFTLGRKVVSFILMHIARLRSHELFTLTLLALTFVIATASAVIFGTSIALGAFIAGMVIGQTHVKHQASANALPMKDAFAVIFFLTVGMIFNPTAITENWVFFIGVLIIVLIIKPLAAFLIVWVMRYPLKVALTVALALAQIGEFSFILGEEAIKFHLLPDEGYDIIVACALISISLNPLIFRGVNFLHSSIGSSETLSLPSDNLLSMPTFHPLSAVIVGFGPLGRGVAEALHQLNFNVTVIDQNVDTIAFLRDAQQRGVFGDATNPTILEEAHIEEADLLLITVPSLHTTINIIEVVQPLNPGLKILARSHYLTDHQKLQDLNIESICSEEETKKAFIQAVYRVSQTEFET